MLGLGDLRPHAPIMLAWMLGQFMAKGASGLQAAQRYGEVAMGANVLQVLHDMLQADFNAHPLVSDILHSLAYGVMSALVQVCKYICTLIFFHEVQKGFSFSFF